MAKPLSPIGLATCVVLMIAGVARAQDAPQPVAQDVQAQSPPAQPSAPCHLLGCLLTTPAQQPSPQSTQAEVQPAVEQTPSDNEETSKPKSKSAHVVTIVATPYEADRLKVIATTMSKGAVRLLASPSKGAEATADFSVQPVFDTPLKGERAKLFTEQLHIVAGSSVQSIDDLRDKTVSFGPDKGPSQSAARKAFAALNIPVKETPLDFDNALDALSMDDVAAVIVLAPQPASVLTKLNSSGLHLVSWPKGGDLPSGTSLSTIDTANYPTLTKPGETIRTLGVDAVLTISPRGERQRACKTFLTKLARHSSDLSAKGLDLLRADLGHPSGRRVAADDR